MLESVSSYSSIATRKGTGGLASGLDTDELVKSMTLSTRNKITKNLKSKEVVSWKTDTYRSISTKLIAFSEKYMSFTSTSNLFSDSFFDDATITSSGTNASKVSATGTVDSNLGIYGVSSLAQKESFITQNSASTQAITTDQIDLNAIGRTVNNLAGETINLKYGDTRYNVTFAEDFSFSAAELADPALAATKIASTVNAQLAKITLKDGTNLGSKIQMTANAGALAITADATGVTVVGGSGTSLAAMGITVGKSSPIQGTTIDTTKLESKLVFNDVIKGKSMIFDLNGISKKITFDATASFANMGELKTAIQSKLDTAFGAGQIKVDTTDGAALSGKLEFTTLTSNSILTVGQADTNLLGNKGIFNVDRGVANRLNINKPLLEGNLNGLSALPQTEPETPYEIVINGTSIKFTKDKAISEIIDQINSSDAGVKVQYLSTTDKISVTATESGSQGKIDISDTTGNFAASLFGANDTVRNVTDGKDAVLSISYDGGKTKSQVTRTTNSFNLDGLNITLNGQFEVVTDAAGKVISGGDPITFGSTQNTDKVVESIQEMVKSYNEIVTLVNTEVATKPNRKYEPLTAEQEADMTETQIKEWNVKAKAGMLFGDSDLRSLCTELRFAFTQALPGVGSPSDMGITTGSSYKDNGKIVIDETKLKAALQERPEEVKKMFTMAQSKEQGATTSDAGLMTRVKTVFDKYASTTGYVKGIFIRQAGLENSLTTLDSVLYKKTTDIDKEITTLKAKLKIEEDRYYSQFTSLEQYVSQMNSQSSWLTQQTS